MKKIVYVSLLVLSTLVVLTGCDKKKSDYKLEIKESSWSGWSEDYEPEETTKEYEIVLNKEYVVNPNSLGLTFTIKKINKDSIVIETTEPFSDSKEGIDLYTKKTEFTVKAGETLELTTPTMDSGDIYYLRLIK